jgi:hypothetical protein
MKPGWFKTVIFVENNCQVRLIIEGWKNKHFMGTVGPIE